MNFKLFTCTRDQDGLSTTVIDFTSKKSVEQAAKDFREKIRNVDDVYGFYVILEDEAFNVESLYAQMMVNDPITDPAKLYERAQAAYKTAYNK